MPQVLELTFDEVVEAGRLLFGPGFTPHGRWRDDLRSAFRRRSFETHPDRALALGRRPDELAREFASVSDAYRALAALRVVPAAPRPPPAAPGPFHPRARPAPHRPAPPPRPAPHRPAPPRAHAPPHAHAPWAAAPEPARPPEGARPAPGARVWTADDPLAIPRRRLRLAEFLYYSGKVPWSAMVESVAWQRRQRPAVGTIAAGFGFLTPAEVAEILARRLADREVEVPFGEYALRAGYLTPFQLLATLGRQLRLQRPIGQFFVERGLVDDPELERLRRRMFSHNLRWR